MMIFEKNAKKEENLKTLYSGLSLVSSGGRKYLKTVAQSLITMQNQPDVPVSDIVGRCKEIFMRKHKTFFSITLFILILLMMACSGKRAREHFEKGKAFFDQTDYETAILELTDAIKFDENFTEAYIYRSNAYIEIGDYDEALSDVNNAIRLSPQQAENYYLRANVYYNKLFFKHDLDALSQVIENLNKVIMLDSNFEDAYFFRGKMFNVNGDYDLAINDINHAINLNPKTEYYSMRGRAYYNKKDYDKAIADYETALLIDPDSSFAKEQLEIAKKGIFGDYPDEFLPEDGLLKRLFGKNAKFATSYNGKPVFVTVEFATGNSKEFSVQLLLSMKTESGDVEIMRLYMTFTPNYIVGANTLQYIKLENLQNGRSTALRYSAGDFYNSGRMWGVQDEAIKIFWEQ